MSIIKMDQQYISTKYLKGQLFTVVGYDSHRVYLRPDSELDQPVIATPIFYFIATYREYKPYQNNLNSSQNLVDNETRELLLSIMQEGLDDLIENNLLDTQQASHLFNHIAFSLLKHDL
jgi:hypothetical protein